LGLALVAEGGKVAYSTERRGTMTDPYKLVAFGHAWDLAAAALNRRVESFAFASMIPKDTEDAGARAERARELSPGAAPFERMVELFEEVLGNYGFKIVYEPTLERDDDPPW
jgi:hypothetical protein